MPLSPQSRLATTPGFQTFQTLFLSRVAALALAATLTIGPTHALAQTRTVPQPPASEVPRWSFAIHGGAGVIERASLSPEQDAAYRASLIRALEAGGAVLERGGTALDAIQAAIELMEDDPLFNAGRGAVFTAAGRNELDAAVMNGADLTAGAVAGLTTTRHPIAAARAVMEHSPHVMLIGPGADSFAASQNLEQVDPAFFFSERRWQGLVKALTEAGQPIPDRPAGAPPAPVGGMADNDASAPPLNERKFGTVGAVALDTHGNLAAGTSTGGTTGKRWGRVGDVPVIGAGTYASNGDGCAVSATGDGEYFIRATVARDICARIALARDERARIEAAGDGCEDVAVGDICLGWHFPRSGQMAAQAEIDDADALGGKGGVIVMQSDGTISFAMSTSGMYRGLVTSDEPRPEVAIYADETPQ
ncbi:Isoaspartyl peptidase [Brevundimonas sp. NIBR10]|uniref:isoaspartyl peptidase/L-asparaginase family protein n=1 Tax=Brevundimonas sp. NIBR10 TaxID=3015997 RepID=UPI0022F188ED|nr:isoaspartyl peptidase/L-asparaginase [Brevundimonas sp. NIBR10]WGM46485.1 Isoaspartyl peptidase [Brevundimonas sp. NIBR10]